MSIPDFISNTQKAVITKLTGSTNDFNTAVNGRVFNEVAPPRTTFPFVSFIVTTATPERDSVNKFERLTLKFGVYDNIENRQNVNNIINKLINQLEDTTLSITGCSFVTIDRGAIIPAPTDDTVFGRIVPYEIELQH